MKEVTDPLALARGATTAHGSGPGPLPAPRSPLVWEASTGDPEALSALLERARPVVYEWAFQKTGDPDDAEDISQIVLFRLWRGLSSFRGESKLSSWLYRITVNEVAALRRKERHSGRSVSVQHLGGGPGGPIPLETERILHVQACGLVRNVACALPPSNSPRSDWSIWMA